MSDQMPFLTSPSLSLVAFHIAFLSLDQLQPPWHSTALLASQTGQLPTPQQTSNQMKGILRWSLCSQTMSILGACGTLLRVLV